MSNTFLESLISPQTGHRYLEEGHILIGDTNNMESPILADFVLEGLGEGNIWVGNSDGKPEESTALKDFFSRYLNLRQEVLNLERKGTFIVQKAHYLLEHAQALNKLAPGGMLKSDSEGIISIATSDDYVVPAALDAKFIIQQPSSYLPNAQDLISLFPGGILKSGLTGSISIAKADEDYASQQEVQDIMDSTIILQRPSTRLTNAQSLINLTPGGMLKVDPIGILSIAIGGIDYATEAEIISLQGQIDALESEIIALQVAVAALEAEIIALQVEIAAIQLEIFSLKLQVRALEAAVAALQIQVAALEVAVAALEAEVAAIEAQIAEIIIEIAAIQAELVIIEANLLSIHVELAAIWNADITLEGDVSGTGKLNQPIQTNLNLNLNQISDKNVTTGDINMAGYNIKNVSCQPNDSDDAVNVCFLWKMLNGEVDILWQ